jgi:tocopherol cyclase
MMRLLTMLMSETFQGAHQRSPYFEGWYYKLQAADGRLWAFIPGVSLSESDPHSFIQIVSDGVSDYKRYPLEAFHYSQNRLEIRVGNSVFTRSGLHIDTDTIIGEASFIDAVPFSHKKYSTGIMGPFALMPYLECRHGVVMVKSRLSGFVQSTKDGQTVKLDGGSCYIEKDWGCVFPDPYIWVHAFLQGGGSFMLSTARVPVLGHQLRGLAAFLYADGHIRRFATYGGAVVSDITASAQGLLKLEIKAPMLRLFVTLKDGDCVGLMAPEKSGMGRQIRESVNGDLLVELKTTAGRQLFADSAQSASIELCGDIMKLKRNHRKPC